MNERADDTEVATKGLPYRGLVALGTGLVLMVGMSGWVAGDLPDRVVLEGAGTRGADAEVSRLLLLTLLPAVTAAIGGLLLAGQRIRRATAERLGVALWRDDREHRRSVDIACTLIVPVMAALHFHVLQYARGEHDLGLRLVAAVVGAVVCLVGNLLPKSFPVSGVALETLRLDASPGVDRVLNDLRRLYRPLGAFVLVLGVVAAAVAFVSPVASLVVSVVATVLMGALIVLTGARSAVRQLGSDR